MDQWGDVGITKNGYSAAKELGKSLASQTGFAHMNVYSWGQRRTWETAQAIASGMAEGGGLVCSKGGLSWESPISRHDVYDEYIRGGMWQSMLDSWQQGEDVRGSLKPIDDFAPSVFRKLLNPATSPSDELTLVATHDLNVVPLSNFALGRSVHMPDYLDGLLLAERERRFQVGYGELFGSAEFGALTD